MVYGVIRYEDNPLLPSNSPIDHPKLIRSGIDEEGQHPQSPKVTGPDGAVSILHRLGRRWKPWQDLYITRYGNNVESGRRYESPGMRYIIRPKPASAPRSCRTGPWLPVSTTDLGDPWGGAERWVRAQGEAFAKSIFYQKRWQGEEITRLEWSGMTETEKKDIDAWRQTFAAKKDEKYHTCKRHGKGAENLSWQEQQRLEMEEMDRIILALEMKCKADCGVENATLRCTRCRKTRYCSVKCQKEDWKYHKTYCKTVEEQEQERREEEGEEEEEEDDDDDDDEDEEMEGDDDFDLDAAIRKEMLE